MPASASLVDRDSLPSSLRLTSTSIRASLCAAPVGATTAGEEIDADAAAIAVGAGPAGLAVSSCLSAAGANCMILEQGDQVGMSWRRNYDRLHLHTDKGHSELPFLSFDAAIPRYPSRLQFIDYLERYARRSISRCASASNWRRRGFDSFAP
jgi:choline dehydrogenase-like flavoprotein